MGMQWLVEIDAHQLKLEKRANKLDVCLHTTLVCGLAHQIIGTGNYDCVY